MSGGPIGLLGIVALLLVAVALSADRRAIRPRVVAAAFAAQAGVAVLVLFVPWGRAALAWAAGGVAALLGYADAGTRFLFGPLATDPLGRMFAIQALPVIVFFSALISVLYHLRVMPLAVRWIGGAIERLLGVSRVESLCAAANIFVGQSESPLVIRPYLPALTRPQLFAVMTNGMAGVAGTILAAYAAMGVRIDYLLAASVMSAPGGLLMAKIVMPDPRTAAPTDHAVEHDVLHAAAVDPHGDEPPANIIMAAAQGAQLGVRLAVAVGATVFAFVALVALANGVLAGVGHWFGADGLSFQALLGWLFAPLMVLLGVPWHEAGLAGALVGEKIVLNEFVAYLSLAGEGAHLSPHTAAVVTFALCGFANFSSIAIQLAVTGGLAPNQRPEIARLGLRALAAGTLANLMSAALAGLMV